MPESARMLLGPASPGLTRRLLGKAIEVGMRITGLRRYDDYRREQVRGMQILVLPGVANPRVLRTGAFFAECLDPHLLRDRRVLDMGTGSGVCALVAARHAQRVVAVDISAAAVRCARINTVLNQLEERVEIRRGDLFEPVAGEAFDLVLFNPPFQLGVPRDERDAAWRSGDVAARFARDLGGHLAPGAEALLLLSSFGNACECFIDELRARGFALGVFARRRYINETVTLFRVSGAGGS